MFRKPVYKFLPGAFLLLGLFSPIFGQNFYLGSRSLYTEEQSQVSGSFWLSNRNNVPVSKIAFHLNIETPEIFLNAMEVNTDLNDWTLTLDSLGDNRFAVEVSGNSNLSQAWVEAVMFTLNWDAFPSEEIPTYYASSIVINDSINIPNSNICSIFSKAPPGFLEGETFRKLGDANEDGLLSLADVNEALTSFKNSNINQKLLDISNTPGVNLYDIGLLLKNVLGMNPEMPQNTLRVENGAVLTLSDPLQLGETHNFVYKLNVSNFTGALSLYLQFSVDTSLVEQIVISGFSPRAALVNGWDQSNRLNIYNLAMLMPFEDTKPSEDVISLLVTHKSENSNPGLEIISADVNETEGYMRNTREIIWKEGCTDPEGFNYDPEAVWDDNSCGLVTNLKKETDNAFFRKIRNNTGLKGIGARTHSLHIELFNFKGQMESRKHLAPLQNLFFDQMFLKPGVYLLKVKTPERKAGPQIFKIYLP